MYYENRLLYAAWYKLHFHYYFVYSIWISDIVMKPWHKIDWDSSIIQTISVHKLNWFLRSTVGSACFSPSPSTRKIASHHVLALRRANLKNTCLPLRRSPGSPSRVIQRRRRDGVRGAAPWTNRRTPSQQSTIQIPFSIKSRSFTR